MTRNKNLVLVRRSIFCLPSSNVWWNYCWKCLVKLLLEISVTIIFHVILVRIWLCSLQAWLHQMLGLMIRWQTNCWSTNWLAPGALLFIVGNTKWELSLVHYNFRDPERGSGKWSKAMLQDITQMYFTELGSFVYWAKWNLTSPPSHGVATNVIEANDSGHDLFDWNVHNRGENLK